MKRENPALDRASRDCGLGKTAISGAYPNTRLPLVVSLKRALVFSAAEGFIPREHAKQLLALLGLREA